MRFGVTLPFMLALAVVASACTGGAGDRRVFARAAVRAYAAAAPAVESRQREFVAAWTAAREASDVATLRERGEAEVLPKLDALVDGLAAMPVGTTRLAILHARQVVAWHDFRRRLARYYKRLTAENLVRSNAGLEEAWSRLAARIVEFRAALEAYYGELGLTARGSTGGTDTTWNGSRRSFGPEATRA